MKTICALLIIITFVCGNILPVAAGHPLSSKRRMQRKYEKSLKQQKDYWKKHETDMEGVGARTGSRDENGSQTGSKAGKRSPRRGFGAPAKTGRVPFLNGCPR